MSPSKTASLHRIAAATLAVAALGATLSACANTGAPRSSSSSAASSSASSLEVKLGPTLARVVPLGFRIRCSRSIHS